MKKLFKIIPLLVLPLSLSSCSIIESFINGGGNEQEEVTDNNVYPTSLVIEGENKIVVGESTTLTAKFSPTKVTNNTVTWTSSNNSVATVTSGGKVTGKANGNVTITASMKGANKTTITATHEMTVGTPAATGVQLDKTSVTLEYGKTTQLTATVNPKYSSQDVTWSSSNSTIATVSNSGLVTAKNIEGTAVITATSVDGGFTASCQITVKEVVGTTVMIYMCGADLESDNGLASMDLDEILSVSGQPDEVNILVETGGAKSWKKSQIPSNKLARWEIRNRQFIKKSDSFTTNTNMGLTSTLQSFLEWGFENYQSDKYGLILWNHGGAMGGCCFDENNGDDSLSADEVYTAVKNARANKGISDKLEWITYDACLMAVQDIAEYNSYNFNYMLSSQESEAGYGYDYDAWLPDLYANTSIDTTTLLEKIGHTFIEEEKNLYSQNNWGPCDQTQSVYDLSKMPAYKTAFESLANSLYGIIQNSNSKASALADCINSAQKYGVSEDDYGDVIYPFDVFDVASALSKIVANSNFSSLSSKATAVNNALSQLVVYEEHGTGTTGCGICLFCPISQYTWYYDAEAGAPTTNFTNWKNVANKIAEVTWQ